MEDFQTLGKSEYRKGGGHHRIELDLIHKLTEGLDKKEAKNFIKDVNIKLNWNGHTG